MLFKLKHPIENISELTAENVCDIGAVDEVKRNITGLWPDTKWFDFDRSLKGIVDFSGQSIQILIVREKDVLDSVLIKTSYHEDSTAAVLALAHELLLAVFDMQKAKFLS